MATSGNVLSTLTGINGGITLAIEVAGQLVPLVKGAIMEIRQIATGSETVTYELLVQTDQAELGKIIQLSTDDLATWNAELVRQGAAPLPVPPVTGGPDPGPITQSPEPPKTA